MQPYTVDGNLVMQKFPLVVDTPHSWKTWPSMQSTSATSSELMTSWDAFVDELWALALQQRAPLLSANFHRAYIDANRALTPACCVTLCRSPSSPRKNPHVAVG